MKQVTSVVLGLILLDFVEGKEEEVTAILTELNAYDGVVAQKMEFSAF